ncbi:hypothetical protein B0H11DRAFT_2291389 [Mycena galericulata]|nr:hypothetical protein B0H11DRAFT_2291389 [Mycena galericulata]
MADFTGNDKSSKFARPRVIPKLMLVAWRVKEWVDPLLYRTIVLTYKPTGHLPAFMVNILLTAIRSKPAAFFRRWVENLYPAAPGLILADLAPHVLSAVKRLHITSTVFNALPSTHSLFAQITHLQLMVGHPESENLVAMCSALSYIPRLTHLSLNEECIPMCLPILQTCTFLEVLVNLGGRLLAPIPAYRQYESDLAHDPRFVVLEIHRRWYQEWLVSLHTGIDYWSCAERFIAKRQSGEIDPLLYLVPNDQRTPDYYPFGD